MKDETQLNQMHQFPWLGKNYQNPYDDLAYDATKTSKIHIYPKASDTDKVIVLDKQSESTVDEDFVYPQRFLVITASSCGADNVLQKFE